MFDALRPLILPSGIAPVGSEEISVNTAVTCKRQPCCLAVTGRTRHTGEDETCCA
jgi:hypothetical protein